MYNKEFQNSVLRMLCENVMFATTYITILKNEYFESHPSRIIFGVIYQYVLNYNRELDKNNLLILLQEHIDTKGMTQDSFLMLKEECNAIFKTHVANEEFVKDKLTSFVKTQAATKALYDGAEILKAGGSPEQVLKLMETAVHTGDTSSKGLSFQDFLTLPERYAKYYDTTNLTSTGFYSYDESLGGGMAPGELHVIMGPPKAGKSTLGVNIGSNVLLRGKAVFHISLELKRDDVLMKYASRLTALTRAEIMHTKTDEYMAKMREYEEKKPQLFVEYWTMNTINAMTIRSWVAQTRARTGVQPSLIIVDYDDLLKPVEGKTDNQYHDSGGIYSDLIGIGDYFKCPVLTFAQPSRPAWNVYNDKQNPRLITMGDLAHSAMKAHHCTSITTLNFKSDSNDGIMYVDISRRGESHKEIKIRKNYAISVVKQIFEG